MKFKDTKKAAMGFMAGVVMLAGIPGIAVEMDEAAELRALTKDERIGYMEMVANSLPYTLLDTRTTVKMPNYMTAEIGKGEKKGVMTLNPGDYDLTHPFEVERVTLSRAENVQMPSSHWAREEALSAVEKGYIRGDENGDLNLEGTLTGGESMTALNRVFIDKGVPELDTDREWFSELFGSGHWASNAVKSVFARYDFYTVKQTDADDFEIDGEMTREKMANILYRATSNTEMMIALERDLIAADGEDIVFGDQEEISPDKKDGVSFCVKAGILKGDDKGNMNPKKPVSRAEFMVFLGRIEKAIAEIE